MSLAIAVTICMVLFGLVIEIPLLLRIRQNPWALLPWLPLAVVPVAVFATLLFPYWLYAYTSDVKLYASGFSFLIFAPIFMAINFLAEVVSALVAFWLAALILFPGRPAWNRKGAVAGTVLTVIILGWYFYTLSSLQIPANVN